MHEYVTGDIFTSRPPKQSLRAWEPFWDCVGILFQLQHLELVDGDEELPDWKLPWIAGIALLRTIGHVLAKVDANKSRDHSREIEHFWRALKSDRESSRIFWDFIENERNNLLKTYTFGARLVRDEDGSYVEFNDGSDAFQTFRQAVYWWRYQLSLIEAAIPN
ncbi:hypothetical protein [Sinorhizobium americanum]|uniref:hypothetical protein n=1 Tax=Sinorhizobium americanum TaxID=194963 RepID=UPI00056D6FF5|nr:hypothetical protein [Sinorhizobium americanum]